MISSSLTGRTACVVHASEGNHLIEVAITPRSFRETPGSHQTLLKTRGITPRYPDRDYPLDNAEMVALVAGCPALIVGTDEVSEDVLSAGPLRAVVKYGTGMDNIDLEAVKRHGVRVGSTPGTNARSVAELTIGLMLSVARNIPLHDRAVRAGEWSRRIGIELKGRRLGLVGYGAIGREVARLAAGLGMAVVAYDPYVEVDIEGASLEDVLTNSDVISLHLPLTEETQGLLSADKIKTLKEGAVLINTARGGLVDEDALTDELHSGRLRGAAFDTFRSEPSSESPLLESDLFVASPHVGAATMEAVERTGTLAIERLIKLLEGES